MTETMQTDLGNISRLIYLANRFRCQVPRTFAKFIPHADLLSDIATKGVEGTQVDLGANMPSLEQHLIAGAQLSEDPGSDTEFNYRIARIVENRILNDFVDDYTLSERLRLFRLLDEFVVGGNMELVGRAEASLEGDDEEVDGIVKWKTGLEFLDLAFKDGSYQGLHILMGNPGTGKTSTLLALMGALRQHDVASSIWYFSLETPLKMVRWRMTPLRQSIRFVEDDRIIAGITPLSEVVERIHDNPDPERIILFDGPDVLTGGSTDGRRFALEDAFRELVQIKQACKAVFVPSQPRRGEQQGLSLESVAESWSKAWYSDTVFGIERQPGFTTTGGHRLKITNFKNRFGPMGQIVYYNIDYGTFDYEISDGPGSMQWDNAPVVPEGQQDAEGTGGTGSW